jgi:hypothetical protein
MEQTPDIIEFEEVNNLEPEECDLKWKGFQIQTSLTILVLQRMTTGMDTSFEKITVRRRKVMDMTRSWGTEIWGQRIMGMQWTRIWTQRKLELGYAAPKCLQSLLNYIFSTRMARKIKVIENSFS